MTAIFIKRQKIGKLIPCDNAYLAYQFEFKLSPYGETKKNFLDVPMSGNEREIKAMKNTDVPDAIDLLNRNDDMLKKYDYLVDLTVFNHSGIMKSVADFHPLRVMAHHAGF